MKTQKTLLLLLIGFIMAFPPRSLLAAEVGLGYGRQMRSETDLEQFELFGRQSLPFTTDWGDTIRLSSALEYGAALIHYYGPDDAVTGRFSIMPMAILSFHPNINVLAGIGAGFMVGQTDFGEHDLDGPVLFNAKIGFQALLGKSWGIEYTFYHQSNGSIYDNNDSLNMNQLALTFRF